MSAPIEQATMPEPDDNVTRILLALRDGDRTALDSLLPTVYRELHARAERFMRRERPGHTLQPTALVHEAYLRLVDQRRTDWQCRTHFFAAAAEMMRRILVDYARTRTRSKRGGKSVQVTLDEMVGGMEMWDHDVLALNETLERLARVDERQARIVELRFFGGLSVEEAAEVLGLSPRTVAAEWAHARAWLKVELARTEE
jgi:RNA polymerase sigma factor (TIGR02999 family)